MCLLPPNRMPKRGGRGRRRTIALIPRASPYRIRRDQPRLRSGRPASGGISRAFADQVDEGRRGGGDAFRPARPAAARARRTLWRPARPWRPVGGGGEDGGRCARPHRRGADGAGGARPRRDPRHPRPIRGSRRTSRRPTSCAASWRTRSIMSARAPHGSPMPAPSGESPRPETWRAIVSERFRGSLKEPVQRLSACRCRSDAGLLRRGGPAAGKPLKGEDTGGGEGIHRGDNKQAGASVPVGENDSRRGFLHAHAAIGSHIAARMIAALAALTALSAPAMAATGKIAAGETPDPEVPLLFDSWKQLDQVNGGAATASTPSPSLAEADQGHHLLLRLRRPFRSLPPHRRHACRRRPAGRDGHAHLRDRRWRRRLPRRMGQWLWQADRDRSRQGHRHPLRPPLPDHGRAEHARASRRPDRPHGLHRPLHRQPPPLRGPHRRARRQSHALPRGRRLHACPRPAGPAASPSGQVALGGPEVGAEDEGSGDN